MPKELDKPRVASFPKALAMVLAWFMERIDSFSSSIEYKIWAIASLTPLSMFTSKSVMVKTISPLKV